MLGERYQNDKKPTIELNELQQSIQSIVSNKVDSGHYQFEKVPCCICHGENFELLSEKDRYGLYVPVVICRDCGLIQTNPRMTQSSYQEFYENEYRKLYVGTERPASKFFKGQVRQGKKIAGFLKKNGFKNLGGKFVLEVGCGAGGILKHFRDLGCHVKGCDLGSEYLQYGIKNHELDLVHGSLDSLVLDAKPDIIIYSHVLEHVLDPNAELALVKSLLADDGILFIEVPGVKNIDSNYRSDLLLFLQNAHIYHFTQTSLLNLLKNNGMDILKINEYVRCISRKSDISAHQYMNDYDSVLASLEKFEKGRQFYTFTFKNIIRVIKLNSRRLSNLINPE